MMDLAIEYHHGLDVHVGRVAGNDADLLDRALSVQAKYSGEWYMLFSGRTKSKDRGVELVGVDQQAEFVAGPYSFRSGTISRSLNLAFQPSYPCPMIVIM